MAEAAFRKLQIGPESTFGTEVDATIIFPCDPGSGEFTLSRGTNVPDEDYGRAIRNQTGRGSHGVRVATASLAAAARYQDLGYLLNMAMGTASTSGSGTYTHVWVNDTTSQTVKSYTVESTDGVAPFIATGVLATGFELGFDALGAGQNSPWNISADLQAANLAQGTATTGLSDPSALETIEGHLTTIAMGPVGTAYGSLSTVGTALVQYSCGLESAKPLRPYGGADVATSYGRGKAAGDVTILMKVSSATIDESFDIFNVSGAVPTERRVRMAVTGSSPNVMYVDHRLLFTDVHIEPDGRDGERLVSISAQRMYDSTLASDLSITIINLIASY